MSTARSEPVSLAYPGKLITDEHGNLWIADTGHHRVIGADRSGVVHTIIGCGQPGSADGSLEQACFDEPQGLALSPNGAVLYVADCRAHAIRRVDLAGRAVTTILSNATAEHAAARDGHAGLENPWDLALDQDAHVLYMAVAGAHGIARLCLMRHTVAFIAGTGTPCMVDGPCARAGFARPSGLCLSSDRRRLYVADQGNSAVRVIDLAAATVATLAQAPFQGCMGIAMSPAGIVVTDTENHAVRGINHRHNTVVTLWQGQGSDRLCRPAGVAFDRVERAYVVADTHNHRLMRIARDASSARVVALGGR